MSAAASFGYRIGNQLYKVAFPIYRPLYSAFKSYVDRAERELLARHLSAGCVAVDVGANIGVYSEFLLNCVGDTGVVHSFEPSPENFARLRDLSMDLMFVTTKGVMPFDARNVRSDATWYVNLFASRGRPGDPRLPGSRAETSTGAATWIPGRSS